MRKQKKQSLTGSDCGSLLRFSEISFMVLLVSASYLYNKNKYKNEHDFLQLYGTYITCMNEM